ncbi:plasminogen receptor (KT) [Bombyx mandarina]|uniref:Plasminogen receptor (KT) n=2 Tax=Bombyx TaxID=7090 RepID=A0A8R1WK77_BOMMO|nr:plasminogen receptor (KT) [Bombyx mori]XP_028036767.1 plasminogen receptor (KT) [Bombyx mandarina]
MGNLFSVSMEENYKRNQEFLQTINKVKMERQIQLQYQMQERQMALEIAKNRDTCLWITAFYITTATGLFTGFRRTKRQYLLMPLVPLTFITLYYWDLAYGNKVHRIRMEAEHVMTHEAESLEWPCGLPSPSSIDLGRFDEEEKKRIHPPLLL